MVTDAASQSPKKDMSIKINDHDQTVTLSVTDLCGEEQCSGSLNRTPLLDIRGELGREVHQYYQSELLYPSPLIIKSLCIHNHFKQLLLYYTDTSCESLIAVYKYG